jgi:hypothetical protein
MVPTRLLFFQLPYHSTVFIAVTAVVAFVALVCLVKWAGTIEQASSAASGGNMESVSVTFGDPVEQSAFAREYSAYLGEWYFLQEAIKKVMLDRTINPGIKADAAAVVDLPDDDPRVLAVEDRYEANIASFVLARTAIDDFSELLILASNGWGIGALKTLRGMYERVVTSAYVALEPPVSRALVDDTWVQSWRTWKRAVALVPTVATSEKVREMAERGGALHNLESRQMLEYGIESGRGGVTLKLTAEQFAKLKAGR